MTRPESQPPLESHADEVTCDRTLLATRGDRLALIRDRVTVVVGAAGPSEVIALSVVRSDGQGRVAAQVTFDPDALDAAYDELDRRYVQLGGPDLRPYRHAYNARDLERYRELFAPDCRVHDQRLAGWGTLDLDGFIAHLRAMLEMAPDAWLSLDHVVATDGIASLVACTNRGTHDGGVFEFPNLGLTTLGADRRITETWMFEIEDLDEALAAYERVRAPSLADRFANAAWRASQRFVETSNARDEQAFAQVLAPNFVYLEHRSGLGHLRHDGSSLFDTMFVLDEWHSERRLIATRGDALAIVEVTATFRDGATGTAEVAALVVVEVAALVVVEVDAEERIVRHVSLDVDATAEAYAELDARHLELSGDDVGAFARAFAARDWEAFADLFEPGCVVVDHRVAGWEGGDFKSFLDHQRRLLDLASDTEILVDYAIGSPRGVGLTVCRAVGTHEGGRWELPMVTVTSAGRTGRTATLDLYDLDAIDEAQQHLNRLSRPTVEDIFGNAAWRSVLAHQRLIESRDVDAFDAAFAPDFEDHDRRSGIRLMTLGEAALAPRRTLLTLADGRLEHTLMATRGDRLALISLVVAFRDGNTGPAELALLTVQQVDEAGKLTHSVAFDLDDLEAAYAELDARYLALGGPDVARWRAAFNAGDWEGFAGMIEPTCQVMDRRTAGLGSTDVRGFVEHQRRLFDLAPDTKLWTDHTFGSASGASMTLCHVAGTRDGGSWELPMVIVASAGPDGRPTALELYDLDALDAAKLCFDELSAPSLESVFGNAAWRALQAIAPAAAARDIEALESLFAPDFVNHDRRSGVAHITRGKQATEHYRTLASLDDAQLHRRLLATRGEQLALVHTRVEFRDGVAGQAEVVALNVVEVDRDGLVTYETAFDVDDLDAAYTELDRRYVMLGGTEKLGLSRTSFNARDWETYRATVAPDCVVTDHRTAGWGALRGEAFVDYQREMVELASDTKVWVDHFRSTGEVDLNVSRQVGTRDGGAWERIVASVATRNDDDLLASIDIYDVDDLASAQQRYHELCARN